MGWGILSYSKRMKLDDEQQEVVEYGGSCFVIAGPGSGKTRTLVGKAEMLWEEGEDLVCLTFTRAAAKELRERMPGVQAQTIHSYCYGEIGWPGTYDQLLDKFIDKKEKEKYKWVLLDECQDLTREELEVVQSITGDKLFAVGDPYQSIYGWNGALGMGVFTQLAGLKEFKLKNNYRSCPTIVEWLNAVYRRDLVSKNVVENGLTAVLCRTNYNVWEASQVLSDRGISYTVRIGASELTDTKEEDHGSNKLKVMTCHCSKGLEFDNVVLYKWFPEPFWGEEKNLYYVSLARASKNFREVGQPSSLIRVLEELND